MNFDYLFSLENIYCAWQKFRRGKTRKKDVIIFERHLEDNIFRLANDLMSNKYKHSGYKSFEVFDNKKRIIHKATIKDRIVHQIIYDHLVSLYEPLFISDSYASRKNKGQYKALKTFQYFIKLTSFNDKPCYILKCDVKKYFDNIDQRILLSKLQQKVHCQKTLAIIKEIIFSYRTAVTNKGIPLGNVTSQIFANIYLDELDCFAKSELKQRFYIRYNDDFVINSDSGAELEEIRERIINFVRYRLLLDIPLEKTTIRRISWGIEFLGYIALPNAVLMRNKTKSKIFTRVTIKNVVSYLAVLSHCDAYNLTRKLLSLPKVSKVC